MATTPVRFDDSLPALSAVILNHLGKEALRTGVVLRDTIGKLAFFSSATLEQATLERVSAELRQALGAYARTDRVLAGPDDFGASDVLRDTSSQAVHVGEHIVKLVDRRLVGADWLRTPSPPAPPPPRFVFASLKGGVGRSTALSIAAADFASRGRRVLAIDLDMEAPGLGAMLLNTDTVPEFGLIDALLENAISSIDDAFLVDLVAPSNLADRRGRIDVLPAFGRRSLMHPGDVLAKIARAYAETIRDGDVSTMLDEVRRLVDRLATSTRYDAILVDSRAGLHETTATAILGLGAEVFLFGLNEPQTFQGYAALLAHLARFMPSAETRPEWLDRINMVQARAMSFESRSEFAEKCRSLFIGTGLLPAKSSDPTVRFPAEPFSDVPWDDSTKDEELVLDELSFLREPLAILEDERFHLFHPAVRRDLLSEQVYQSSFGTFLKRLNEAFPSAEGNKN